MSESTTTKHSRSFERPLNLQLTSYMISLSSSSLEKFDTYVQSYESLHASSVSISGERPAYFHDYKVQCLKRHGVGSGSVVLDYGCGIGNLTERFFQLTSSVAAFDPSLKSVEVCRQRAPKGTFYTRSSDIPLAAFDATILSGVLHHVPREQRPSVMKNVFSVTKPGGRVFIFEHNVLNPYTRRVIRDCPFDDDADLLRAGEVARLVKVGGFDWVVSEYIVFFPRFLGFLRSFESKLSWLPLGAQTLTIGIKSDEAM